MNKDMLSWYSGLGVMVMFSTVVSSVIFGLFGLLFSWDITLSVLLSFSYWLFSRKGLVYFSLMLVGWLLLINLFSEIPYFLLLVIPLLFTKWSESYWGVWNEQLRILRERFEVKRGWGIFYFLLVLIWEISIFKYGLFNWISWVSLGVLALAVIYGVKFKKVKKDVPIEIGVLPSWEND